MEVASDYPDTPESAITEVLRAEREAVEEIGRAEAQAEEILRQARQDVRAMLRRTQERLARLHARCAEKTRQLISEIEDEAGTYDACDLPGDGERDLVDRAVRDIAAELTTRTGNGD